MATWCSLVAASTSVWQHFLMRGPVKSHYSVEGLWQGASFATPDNLRDWKPHCLVINPHRVDFSCPSSTEQDHIDMEQDCCFRVTLGGQQDQGPWDSTVHLGPLPCYKLGSLQSGWCLVLGMCGKNWLLLWWVTFLEPVLCIKCRALAYCLFTSAPHSHPVRQSWYR